MSKVNNWNFFQQNVQSGLLEGRYINAAFTLIAAGPPRLAATVAGDLNAIGTELGDIAYPIGILQSFSLQSGSQISQLFEIGSERSYFIRGRTTSQASLGGVLYHGPSLLKKLYAYLNTGFSVGGDDRLYPNNANALLNTKGVPGTKQRYVVAPGYENLWVNLASDVFSQPIGLLVYFKDSNEDTVGAFYLEYCMVNNHGIGLDAQGTIISEQASLMFERIVPIDIKAVPLIANSSSLQGIIGNTVIGSAAGPGDLVG